MKTTLYSLLAAAAACGLASAQTAYTTPVGYMTVPLPGTGGGAPQLQLANQGLLPNGPAAAGGGASVTFSGTTMTDTDGAWAAGNYVQANGQVSHLLEITSDGSLKGAMTWITGTGVQTITTVDNVSAAGAGASYRIWQAYTIASLLGNPPTDAVLKPAADVATADNVQIYDPVTNLYTTFFYKTATKVAPAAWQSSDGTIPVPANYAIHPNDGLLFLRKQSGDGSLVVTGSVKDGQTQALVQGNVAPGANTLNIIANQVPVQQVTLGNSGLFTGDPATGVKAAADVASADNILVYNPTTDLYTTFFYKTATKVAPAAWQSSDPAITNPTNYLLPSDQSVLLIRKSGDSFSWKIPSVSIGN